jgi:hypothetical protein
VVKHDAIVKNSQLRVREVQVVVDPFGEFFPVANCVIRDVSDGSPNKSELLIVNCLTFNEFLNDVQRIAGFFSAFFSGSFVAGYCFAVLYLDN